MKKSIGKQTVKKQSSVKQLILESERNVNANFLRSTFFAGTQSEKINDVIRNCSYLSNLVWKFRKVNGWKNVGGNHVVPKNYYSTILNRNLKLRVSQRNLRIIDFLSSEKVIDAIRQRGRMRRKPEPVSKREVNKLRKEMSAILRQIFTRT